MEIVKFKLKGKGQRLRFISQLFFLIASVYTGWRFILFVNSLEKSDKVIINRPPGVEAYLPLSGLVGLKYWIITGVLNSIHPAAVIFLLSFITMGILLKGGFCSWVCPIGWLSENLWKLGEKVFKRNFKFPKGLDYPLRSIKYLILGLFLWNILFSMNYFALASFIYGPYNRAADIKMLLFFKRISGLSLTVILVFVLLSVFIKNFWCRYLCPYGALLGFLSIFSPMKIKRNPAKCTNCKLCSYACPSGIKVHTIETVISDECNACFRCIDACPVEGALEMRIFKRPVKPLIYFLAILLIFLIFTLGGRITGHWGNVISPREYKYIMEHIDTPEFSHR